MSKELPKGDAWQLKCELCIAQALVTSCLERAALSPEAIQHLALHGTGTPLGDPIEVGALSAALQSNGMAPSAHVVAFGSNKARSCQPQSSTYPFSIQAAHKT